MIIDQILFTYIFYELFIGVDPNFTCGAKVSKKQ